MACPECKDTGVVDTGNNDFPCKCPAGKKAIFNVAGRGQMTGAEIDEEYEELKKAPLPDYLD
jgi:hypothetical protein